MGEVSASSVEVISTRTLGKRGAHRIALCRCFCGKEFGADYYKVKTGHTKSCGCLSRQIASKTMTTHGMRRSREYAIWCGMKTRCTNPRSRNYKNYGGRGVTICESWKNSFENFFADMGECPDGMSIERKGPNGNYGPGNCTWATETEQARNKRTSLRVDYAGKSITIKELAAEHGINYHTLRYRIVKIGMNVEEALLFGRENEK